MTNVNINWIFNQEKLKELSLDEASAKIRDAVYQKHAPQNTVSAAIESKPGPGLWVMEVFPGYVIVERGSSEHFKVMFSVTENRIEVSDQLIPVERVWVEK